MAPIKHFDVIVIGLGTAGSATCMELARRGTAVLGIDAFTPPHTMGSHHGESRSIRRAYMEGTAYVPMAIRAWELWRKLEQDTGRRLLMETANLTIGPPGSPAVEGFLKSARTYDIPFEYLTAPDIHARWPQLNPPEDYTAGLEFHAGIICPESAVETFLAEADQAGADLIFNDPVVHWEERNARVSVNTAASSYEAGRLLLAAGAGNKALLCRSRTSLVVKRVPVCWVTPPREKAFSLNTFPVNFWQVPHELQDSIPVYDEAYALPVSRAGGMVKVAPHNGLADADLDHHMERATASEYDRIRTFIKRYIPDLAPQKIRSQVCLYTLTDDLSFWLGPLPGHRNVFISALSGHGFKFAPVLGEILSDMLMGNRSLFDVSMFDPGRAA